MPRKSNAATAWPRQKSRCECGAEVANDGLKKHRATVAHLTAMAAIAAEDPAPPMLDDGRGVEDGAPGADTPVPARERPKVVALPTGRGGSANKQAALDEAASIVEFIQNDLIQTIEPAAPVVARYWSGFEDANTRNWTILCRNHPQLLAGTLKGADYIAYYGLAKFGTGLLVGLGVETGFLAADNRLAQMAGITDAWREVMAERDEIVEEVYDHYRLGEPDDDAAPISFPGLVGDLFAPAAANE